jgi:predicted  nucleic acid-binding Zn-ribbon protein
MTDTQLDPEMELEAQQLANYEDEMRELAEEVNAQDEYFEEHKEEMFEGQKKVDEIIANEGNNKR